MKYFSVAYWKSFGLGVVAATVFCLLVACGNGEEAHLRTGVDTPSAIACQFFYRPSPQVGFTERSVELQANDVQERIEFREIFLIAHFLDKEFDTPFLTITVNDALTNSEIVRHLYQIDRKTGLTNQLWVGTDLLG